MYRHNRGFSLIEVLVSVIILSFGLLAIAALQINSKAAGYDATQRSIATQLARDIVEKMRANPVDSTAGAVNVANYIGTFSHSDYASGTSPSTDCSSVECNAAQLSAFDLWEWQENLNGSTVNDNSGGLEEPIACIEEIAPAGSGFYKVSMTWRAVTEVKYNGDNVCGSIDTDGFRRLIELDVFLSKEGLGVYE